MQAGAAVEMDSVVNPECVPPKKRFNFGIKRKASSPGSSKKQKVDAKLDVLLTLLPDDVLLEILKKCDHHTLAQMRLTCPLFERLVQDFSLWREVRFTVKPAGGDDLDFISSNVNTNTTTLSILGSEEHILCSRWITNVFSKCPLLRHVSLHRQVLDASTMTINLFPSTLVTLDLSRTHMMQLPIEQSYFKDICKYLPCLKRLNLSHCEWFEPHSLMAISKCTNLEVLELADCYQVRDCLAYCGLSTRTGFPALITLDLRRCEISNSELVCFSSIKTLKNLYLEGKRESKIYIDAALLRMCTFLPSHVDDHVQMVQKVHLERLVVRNYKLKFSTLLRLAHETRSLQYIDITGVGIEPTGIEQFKLLRPDVTVVAEDVNQL